MPQPFVSPTGRAAATRGSYGSLHAGTRTLGQTRAPQSPAGVPAKPAKKPMCGPSAFDLLRKMESSQSLTTGDADAPGEAAAPAQGKTPQSERLVCDDEYGGGEDDDDGGFLMPADSDESDGDTQPAPQRPPAAQPRPAPAQQRPPSQAP
eukprot:CAMPEP_0176133570 /NCGR_PEP_ID=MMETSP0120_2-20121206/67714_1 /TAXON_ID=160619 /ORGANISM="Kryptoperidinium foliaceum, Strain CCMP 1326" /LENGTH=149 /DNA_ID=CAMNT_0017469161 /DNA_START=9 /DNA_END=454 /DNA_ORIENTATION=+